MIRIMLRVDVNIKIKRSIVIGLRRMTMIIIRIMLGMKKNIKTRVDIIISMKIKLFLKIALKVQVKYHHNDNY